MKSYPTVRGKTVEIIFEIWNTIEKKWSFEKYANWKINKHQNKTVKAVRKPTIFEQTYVAPKKKVLRLIRAEKHRSIKNILPSNLRNISCDNQHHNLKTCKLKKRNCTKSFQNAILHKTYKMKITSKHQRTLSMTKEISYNTSHAKNKSGNCILKSLRIIKADRIRASTLSRLLGKINFYF